MLQIASERVSYFILSQIYLRNDAVSVVVCSIPSFRGSYSLATEWRYILLANVAVSVSGIFADYYYYQIY